MEGAISDLATKDNHSNLLLGIFYKTNQSLYNEDHNRVCKKKNKLAAEKKAKTKSNNRLTKTCLHMRPVAAVRKPLIQALAPTAGL
jgi:hypothetical protein